jgi:hypothetical protein
MPAQEFIDNFNRKIDIHPDVAGLDARRAVADIVIDLLNGGGIDAATVTDGVMQALGNPLAAVKDAIADAERAVQ